RGARSFSVVGSAVWNLAELAELRAEGGLERVAARLSETLAEQSALREQGRGRQDGGDGDAAGGGDGGRTIRMPTGYEMHPWADLRPAGNGGPPTGRKLWHSSPGSAG
ncbi:hypothetical protein, partial [Streptomyces sp. UH6]|uniref:hypothetical protein n=1 Tax=Streptomyces sp. UH6 TaxID=2748379 RepID=UPI0015D4F841